MNLADSKDAYNELVKLLESSELKSGNESQIEEKITTTLEALDGILEQGIALTMEKRKQAFIEELRPYVEEYGKELCNEFAKYWLSKSSKKARKFHFEKQKTFDMKRRLATWKKNQRKFSIVGMLNKGR